MTRIHITRASGSGTSTIGRALAESLGAPCFDADDYYWLPTDSPFTLKREHSARLSLALGALSGHDSAILAGSITGWGAELEDAFDLVVFLYLDASIRVERLRARKIAELGHADPAFLEWAAAYDAGPASGRSLARHRAWLAERRCPVLELRGDQTVADRVAAVIAACRGANPSG